MTTPVDDRPTPPAISTDYSSATARSRSDRRASQDALGVLEDALAAPTPTREAAWRDVVVDALDTFVATLDDQAATGTASDGLVNEIVVDHPRLSDRVRRLHAEQQDLRDSATSLRSQIAPVDADRTDDIDTADIRDRVAGLARRYRQHRSREADLVYEAINVDLGGGD